MNTNLTLVAPVGILDVPMDMSGFEIPNTDPVEYYTLREYLTATNRTVEIFNNSKTMFAKPLAFSYATGELNAVVGKLADFGLIENSDFSILNYEELKQLLNTEEWKGDDNEQ